MDGTSTDGVAIRRATPADAHTLSRVSELAFTGTFGQPIVRTIRARPARSVPHPSVRGFIVRDRNCEIR